MSRPAPSSVLGLARTPRWLAAAGLVVAFVVVCAVLGRWQWDRTQAILAAERASVAVPVHIEQVYPVLGAEGSEVPADDTGRRVVIRGGYVATLQVAVTGRLLDDRPGVWIVTGLALDDGRVVAVLRGWLPAADSPGSTPPAGAVEVTGVLQPDESFYADAVGEPGTVASIAHDRLAELWSTNVLPGFVVLQDQDPSAQPAPTPVPPTIQTSDVPFPLQNFVYAFQWWVFALFAIAVYARWLWLEARRAELVDYGDGP